MTRDKLRVCCQAWEPWSSREAALSTFGPWAPALSDLGGGGREVSRCSGFSGSPGFGSVSRRYVESSLGAGKGLTLVSPYAVLSERRGTGVYTGAGDTVAGGSAGNSYTLS